MDDSEVVQFLLQTEIIPLCLRIMETGAELSKTVRGLLAASLRSACPRGAAVAVTLPCSSCLMPRARAQVH